MQYGEHLCCLCLEIRKGAASREARGRFLGFHRQCQELYQARRAYVAVLGQTSVVACAEGLSMTVGKDLLSPNAPGADVTSAGHSLSRKMLHRSAKPELIQPVSQLKLKDLNCLSWNEML